MGEGRLSARAGRVIRALLLGVVVSVVVTFAPRAPGFDLFHGWQKRAADGILYAFFRWRERVPTPEIMLVEITEEDLRALGERQPISRRYLADLADFLLRSGAQVVAFDISLTARTLPGEDAALLAILRRWERDGPGRVVFATVARSHKAEGGRETYEALPPFAADVPALFGFDNAPVGRDGVIRHMVPVLPAAGGGFLPSLGLAALAGGAGYSREALARALRGSAASEIALPAPDGAGLLTRKEPIALAALAEAPWRIDFAGRSKEVFAPFPSGPLVQLARSGTRPAEDNPFRGKIVVVGATFEASRDFHPTPVGRMAGVEIQANMIHTLLARRALLPPPPVQTLAVTMGVCVLFALLSLRLRPLWVALVSAVVIAGLVVVSYEAYSRGGYWLDFVVPVAGMLAYLQGSRMLARRRLRSAFGQFVSPEVVERVLQEGTGLGGEVRTVSVLMSDLRGFTTLSERLDPRRISEMMNEYFTEMVEVISARKGIVNDFIGDGILAVYGAPADDPDHAWHAVITALEMQAALRRLNGRWQAEARGPLAMGVAVNTGEVFAGNLGSPRRKKYSVLGDTVNTVARIEGLNRDLGTEVLISGATLAAVKDRVVVRDRGAVPVKGRAQPVELFELVDLREGATSDLG
jgi:adenylate cyclase